MARVSNYIKFSNYLISKNIEFIDTNAHLSVPIRKWDWMFPTEFVLFKLGEYTFAMYKCITTTAIKSKNWIYIIPVKNIDDYYTEANIHIIPELHNIECVKNCGHYNVFDTNDIDTFLNLFQK